MENSARTFGASGELSLLSDRRVTSGRCFSRWLGFSPKNISSSACRADCDETLCDEVACEEEAVWPEAKDQRSTMATASTWRIQPPEALTERVAELLPHRDK